MAIKISKCPPEYFAKTKMNEGIISIYFKSKSYRFIRKLNAYNDRRWSRMVNEWYERDESHLQGIMENIHQIS